jgi:dUTP pyrophosphatase
MIPLKIKKLRSDAKLPSYAHPDDAGMDLYTPDTFTLKAGERRIVELGIASEFTAGHMIEFRDKSGLAAKHGITVLGGIIDAGYRGEWMVTLLNTSDDDYEFEKHEKVAQAVLAKIDYAAVEEVDTLSDHSRGAGHHGSTGKF